VAVAKVKTPGHHHHHHHSNNQTHKHHHQQRHQILDSSRRALQRLRSMSSMDALFSSGEPLSNRSTIAARPSESSILSGKAGSLTKSEDTTNENSTPRTGRKPRVDVVPLVEKTKRRRAKSLTRTNSIMMRITKEERDVMQDQCEFVLSLQSDNIQDGPFAQLSTFVYNVPLLKTPIGF